MGLASEAGVATAILEAVDDVATAILEAVDNITPRSGRIPGCLRKLGKAVVPKAAVARSCVDVEAMPVPTPRRQLHTRTEAIAALVNDRLVLM